MARLHYYRWEEQFTLGGFSSEDSMRDYLFGNPNLIFETDTWAVPIVEEKCLPESSLNKSWGRADIMLCRIHKERRLAKKEKKLALSDIEAWIVELKKGEASYLNGFRQLFDYLVVMKNSQEAQTQLKKVLKDEIEKHLEIRGIELSGDTKELGICGALVAPSFDFLSRTTDLPTQDVTKYRKDYEMLEKELRYNGRLEGGFTLCDAVESCGIFREISLIKVIRFSRADEIVIYCENALGRKAEVEYKLRRVDPVDMFSKGIVAPADTFWFKDQRGQEHADVKCRVLRRRGPSHSVIIEIQSAPVREVPIPQLVDWPYGYDYPLKPVPVNGTTKTISHALHKLYKVFADEDLPKHYWQYGEHNFVRDRDQKLLSQLKEEYVSRFREQ